MRDAAPAIAHDLIARTHHVFASAYLDLLRPARLGQERGDIEWVARERRDRAIELHALFVAHQIKPDRAGRNRARLAVLHPERYVLAVIGRGKTGIEIRRPGIGVMRAGESALGVASAIGVERVFDDVMALRANRMNEKLAGELRQGETLPHRLAVDDDRGRARRDFL